MAAPPNQTSPTRPSPRIRRTLYLIGIAVWTTGVLYWTFDKYLLRHSDAGLSENPLQVWWLRLHAASATTAVWLFGYMCAIHVQRNWTAGARRNSGALFVSLFALLTLTGYLIYYVEADRPLATLLQLHWVMGLFAPLGFLLHRGLRWRLGARRAAATAAALASAPSVEVASATPAMVSAAQSTPSALID
ncbi:MAG TPA: hypothetical protein VHY19_08960 [Steroidobacteraceae bacterium]|nr:hypothetical protein [Steroidobacteraceae bacterium]